MLIRPKERQGTHICVYDRPRSKRQVENYASTWTDRDQTYLLIHTFGDGEGYVVGQRLGFILTGNWEIVR